MGIGVGSTGSGLDQAAKADTHPEAEVLGSVPGGLDGAGVAQALQAAGSRRIEILKRAHERPALVQANAHANGWPDELSVRGTVDTEQATVDHPQAETKAGLLPRGAITLGGQR